MENDTDFYKRLRMKIRKWAKTRGKTFKWTEYVLVAPDLLHLLCKLSIDKKIPVEEKAKLAAAIAYFVSPIDLIPEGITGPAGYVDDVALAAYVLNSVVNNTDPDLVRSHWAGEGDVLELIKGILNVADEMVGSGLWRKLKGFGKGR